MRQTLSEPFEIVLVKVEPGLQKLLQTPLDLNPEQSLRYGGKG